MLFYYIRHGDPIYDPDSLTPLGHEQAKALAKRLCLHGLDQIYSSPLIRARQTAQPTCELLKKEMTICDWASEDLAAAAFLITTDEGQRRWCFHDNNIYQLFNSPEVRALGMDWYNHPAFAKYNFAQGVTQTDEAVDKFLLQLGYEHDRENSRYKMIKPNKDRVALFAHQGFGLCFLSSLLDIPYPMFATHFDFGHTAMTIIDFEEHGDYVYPKVLQLSNDSHLYREGILTGYNNFVHF